MGKTNLFFGTLPNSPWAMLATWLHLRAPQKLQKNRTYNPFRTLNYSRLIRNQNWACLVLPESLQNSSYMLPKQQMTTFGFQGILGVKVAIVYHFPPT
jgi:hypothetical protein